MAYKLGTRSLGHLEGVHPDLVRFVKRMIEVTPRDFSVIDGVRTIEEQRENVRKGVSKTMNSLHLPQSDGFAHAVDLVPIVAGKVSWDSPAAFDDLDRVVEKVRAETGIPAERIGKWDRPHLQLPYGYKGATAKPAPKAPDKPLMPEPQATRIEHRPTPSDVKRTGKQAGGLAAIAAVIFGIVSKVLGWW